MSAALQTAVDAFVEEARGISVGEAVARLGLGGTRAGLKGEHVGQCPHCGGDDRFAFNTVTDKWNCRGAAGGKDAIGMAAHVLALDVRRREDFLLACAAVLGRDVPGKGIEDEGEQAARKARIAERRRQNAEREAVSAAAAIDYREREREKARGKWRAGSANLSDGSSSAARVYLGLRLGCGARDVPAVPFLRTISGEPYWHGTDERGHAVAIHEGPAMVAPFVDQDGTIIGCHLTWIDFQRAPKYRPHLVAGGDVLPTKKMRGTKMGGLIPLVGWHMAGGRILPDPTRRRLVAGEGIENVLAVALAEDVRSDTLYCAAGDLGNLAGPADASSRFAHPELKKSDRNGVPRPLWVAGPKPRGDRDAGDAMPVPGFVQEVMLACDGDSEPYATASAMARAKTRIEEETGAIVALAWSPPGRDFCDLITGRRAGASSTAGG